MFTEDKITEFFCMAYDFFKFLDSRMANYMISTSQKHKEHRTRTLSQSEVMVIMILFHGSGSQSYTPVFPSLFHK